MEAKTQQTEEIKTQDTLKKPIQSSGEQKPEMNGEDKLAFLKKWWIWAALSGLFFIALIVVYLFM